MSIITSHISHVQLHALIPAVLSQQVGDAADREHECGGDNRGQLTTEPVIVVK